MTETLTKPTRDERRAARLADPDRLGGVKLFGWAGAGVSAAANFMLLSYLAMYATDTLHLNPATVGVVILAAQIANIVLGLVAAWIIDRSPETRWGKARPYEFAVPLIWLLTFLVFAVPSGLGEAAKIAWLAVFLLLIKGVADPLLRANDLLYAARSFPTRRLYAKVQTRAAIITSLFAIAISIITPMFLARAGKTYTGWMTVAGAFAIVMGLIGLSRFAFVKEIVKTESGEEPVSFRDIFTAVKANRWIWVLGSITLLMNFVTGANMAGYYFRYVVGNLALQAALAGLGIIMLPALLVVPWLMRKGVRVSQMILVGAILGIVGNTIAAFAWGNLPVLIVGGLFAGLALLPLSYLIPVLLLDLATFNESQGHRRLESTLGALNGIFGNLGMGIVALLVGQLMAASGYDGKLDKQSPAALTTINALTYWMPVAVFLGIVALILIFNRFERGVLPDAVRIVEEHRAARNAEQVVPDTSETVTDDDLGSPVVLTTAAGPHATTAAEPAESPIAPIVAEPDEK